MGAQEPPNPRQHEAVILTEKLIKPYNILTPVVTLAMAIKANVQEGSLEHARRPNEA